jgi:hypothetical protein
MYIRFLWSARSEKKLKLKLKLKLHSPKPSCCLRWYEASKCCDRMWFWNSFSNVFIVSILALKMYFLIFREARDPTRDSLIFFLCAPSFKFKLDSFISKQSKRAQCQRAPFYNWKFAPFGWSLTIGRSAKARNTNCTGRLSVSTVDLLIKVAYFVKKYIMLAISKAAHLN